MTHAKVLALALISTSLASALPALADDKGFGQEGQIILSADRLFGLSFTSVTNKTAAETRTESNTTVGLLWSGGPTPYQIPRIALDVNVVSGFTVGGSIGFVSISGSTKREPNGGPSVEQDSATATLFAFAPRVGYAIPLSDQFAFWPRLGVTYYNAKLKEPPGGGLTPTTTTFTLSGLGLDVEPMFVFSPISHFGITLGPILDVPLSGTASSETTPNPTGTNPADEKEKFLNYGITLGLLGYF